MYLPHWMCGEPRTIGPLNAFICLRMDSIDVRPCVAAVITLTAPVMLSLMFCKSLARAFRLRALK